MYFKLRVTKLLISGWSHFLFLALMWFSAFALDFRVRDQHVTIFIPEIWILNIATCVVGFEAMGVSGANSDPPALPIPLTYNPHFFY